MPHAAEDVDDRSERLAGHSALISRCMFLLSLALSLPSHFQAVAASPAAGEATNFHLSTFTLSARHARSFLASTLIESFCLAASATLQQLAPARVCVLCCLSTLLLIEPSRARGPSFSCAGKHNGQVKVQESERSRENRRAPVGNLVVGLCSALLALADSGRSGDRGQR